MKCLNMTRPIAAFDIESTGISPQADRIIDLCIARIETDGEHRIYNYRVNPGMPIPPETTAIHGISDADVKHAPPFSDVAQKVMDVLKGCDLMGYNLLRFDIPMLVNELGRAGFVYNPMEVDVIDVQRIFHRREPRDLSAALAFYCNEMHLDAHGAEPDVHATIRVLEGQFERYGDLPATVPELAEYCNPRDPSWVDHMGRLKWANNEVVINFGKMKRTPLRTVIETDPGFIKWLLRADFPADTKAIVEAARDGQWPDPPED